MAFCSNCGSQVPEGTKFCTNCGAPVESKAVQHHETESQINEENDYIFSNQGTEPYTQTTKTVIRQYEPNSTGYDRFGKFFGIGLLILALFDFKSDPAILTIVLSGAIIGGCIFCFYKRYKLKGFTIAALVIACFCLLAGISQAKKIGLFKNPNSRKAQSAVSTQLDDEGESEASKQDTKKESVSDEDTKTTDDTVTTKKLEDDEIVSNADDVEETEAQETEEEPAKDEIDEAESDEVESEGGVDPDLKAFMDSYEAFMDEYVDFMKKYSEDPGNAITLMADYTKIMARYQDFAEKIEKYDEDEMSKEDAKYYLEVLNRCNQKMLDLY